MSDFPQSSSAATAELLDAAQLALAAARTSYANFCRISGTPEELVLDFAMGLGPRSGIAFPFDIGPRVTLSYFTARHLLQAMFATIEQYEITFGRIEPAFAERLLEAKNKCDASA